MNALPSWSDLTDDEKIAFFRKHLADGLSFGRMAMLARGISRNALIGKHKRATHRHLSIHGASSQGAI